MIKGTVNTTLLNILRFTRKVALKIYAIKAIHNSLLKHLIIPIISICNYVILRKMGNCFVEMEISSICNSRCIFCPYVDITKTDKKIQTMTSETYDKVLDKLRDVNYKIISFTPTTGDTFVNPEWDSYIEKSLSLPSIEYVLFYTNGILMNEKNIDKLISLLRKDKQKKIFSLLFSLGGYDEKTYLYMFGVDKFNQVIANISLLLNRLQQEKLDLLIHLEFRIPFEYQVNIPNIKKDLNPSKYPFFGARVLREFLAIEGLKRYDGVCYRDDLQDKTNACSYLRKTRFAADGGIWADGCVVSELPNESTLKLGTVDDSWNTIELKRKSIIDSWNKKKEIPAPCKNCTMYRCDSVSLKNDTTIPLWKDLY